MSDTQPLQAPEIQPNRLYRGSELEALLGRRCVELLRQNGLRAVADWYLGETILEAFRHAVASKGRQRVLPERNEHENTPRNLGENQHPNTLHPLPGQDEPDSLSSQIERLRKLSEKKVSGARSRKRVA